MKELVVKRLRPEDCSTPGAAARCLKNLSMPERIATVNWSAYPYAPCASFYAGWSARGIVLHYELVERSIGARCLETNGPVHKDSCVEFFVSDGSGGYFNFEFNAAGTRYAAHGTGRADTKPLPVDTVKSILCDCGISGKHIDIAEDETAWTLSVLIPLEIFRGTILENPAGKRLGANFYKCAEETGAPHFLSWNPIETPEPDFHRPEFFGTVNFEEQQEDVC